MTGSGKAARKREQAIAALIKSTVEGPSTDTDEDPSEGNPEGSA